MLRALYNLQYRFPWFHLLQYETLGTPWTRMDENGTWPNWEGGPVYLHGYYTQGKGQDMLSIEWLLSFRCLLAPHSSFWFCFLPYGLLILLMSFYYSKHPLKNFTVCYLTTHWMRYFIYYCIRYVYFTLVIKLYIDIYK